MIQIKNLSVKYENFIAVKNININIKDGEFFTFLGPSGCGKTTTLRAIAGFEEISEGSILINGVDISKTLPEERGVGFVFQNYALFPSMSVYENIAYGLKVRKEKKSIIQEKVEAIAEKVGITNHLNKKVSELSGGQQQRIAIARALVLQPKILLMDEPLSNLDAKLRISMREEIKRLQKDLKITTVYVTHDQEEALAISDTIAVFKTGGISQIDTPTQIYNNPKNEDVAKFVGNINYFGKTISTNIIKQFDLKLNSEIYIRPEKIKVGKVNSKNNYIRLKGKVKDFEFLGSYSKLNLIVENTNISCLEFNNMNEYQTKQDIDIYFSKNDLIIFERN